MAFSLSSQNVFKYLAERGLCSQEEKKLESVKPKVAKNFNLLLSLQDKRKLLVKQEKQNGEGKTAGEFINEWRNHEFFQQFSELNFIRSSLSEVLHFDAENSIIVFNYLDDYRDLAEFYTKENAFLIETAAAVGQLLATIHKATFDRQEYQNFLNPENDSDLHDSTLINIHSIGKIGPEVFGMYPADGIKFFTLYQRYDSLGKAIAELSKAFEPCCLTHNDLKLNNILLHNDWEQIFPQAETSSKSIVRLIDWERGSWGDPAFDLGTLIASYLQLWLGSLLVSKDISIDKALQLAMIPLELIQPSIAALVGAYLDSFPEIIDRRPNFLQRVLQFAGLALIQQIQAMIQYQKSFGNTGICMLQVAKSLLCRPEQSVVIVFGTLSAKFTSHHHSPV
jgi:hypothetical protein